VDDAMAERIKNRTTLRYQGVTYNVDVKFKNALMNCAPSAIDGYGAYEWVNPERLADIPLLPDELFQIIASHSSGSSPRSSTLGVPSPRSSEPEPIVEASDDLVHDCELLCRCLAKSRLDNYDSWIRLGLCLKRIGCPVALWDAVSRRPAKWRPGAASPAGRGWSRRASPSGRSWPGRRRGASSCIRRSAPNCD
jgi:hypothetical protein